MTSTWPRPMLGSHSASLHPRPDTLHHSPPLPSRPASFPLLLPLLPSFLPRHLIICPLLLSPPSSLARASHPISELCKCWRLKFIAPAQASQVQTNKFSCFLTIPLESLAKTSQNVPQTELLFDRQSLPRHKPLLSQLTAALLLQFTQDKTPRGVLNCSPVHGDSNPPLHCCPGAEPRPPTVTAPTPRSPSAAHPLHSIQLELKVQVRSRTLLRS